MHLIQPSFCMKHETAADLLGGNLSGPEQVMGTGKVITRKIRQ